MQRPKQSTITVNGQDEVLTYDFEDSEYQLLDMYVEQCDALARCSWFRDGHSVQFRWTVEEHGMRWDAEIPPDEAVAAVIHRMRPILLSKEPASFERITGLIGRRVGNRYIRSFLKSVGRRFRGEGSRATMKLDAIIEDSANPGQPLELPVNKFKTFKTWLNGHEYHRDLDKRALTASLGRIIPDHMQRALFLGMMNDAAMAALDLGTLVAVVSGHEARAIFNRVPRPRDAG